MAFRFSELDGGLEDILAGITSKKPMVLFRQRKGSYQIWVEPDYLYIQDLKINIFSAEYHKYNRNAGTYEVDHDMFYFFNPRSGKLIYSEYGSNLEICIINFCSETGKQIDDVGDLLCVYRLDAGKFLREKVLTREKL